MWRIPMNITKYIPSIHNWYVDQGEYKCKDCEGDGEIQTTQMGMDGAQYCHKCIECNGTGKHKNTGELLAEIAGLLVGDALRAWKYKKFAIHSKYITGCFQDYIAQAFIKLFDLCGYLEIKIYDCVRDFSIASMDKLAERLYSIVHELPVSGQAKSYYKYQLSHVYIDLLELCKDQNITIEKHIDARLQLMGVKV